MKISIITINLNDKDGLQKTIESVLGQTYTGFEFIVIDGGSTDGSRELIESYQDRITAWRSEPDSGIYDAMNKGIRLAAGEYVLFLNSGDTLYDGKVLEQVAPALDGEVGIAYGDVVYEEKHGREIRTMPDRLDFMFFYRHSLSHQATFIRRSLFDELFYYNEEHKIISDWEFFTYAICKANVPYRHIRQVISVYDTGGISSNLENHAEMHRARKESLSTHFPALVNDYALIDELQSRRVQQVLHIKKYPLAWRILKGMISLILVFLPRPERNCV